MKRTSGKRWISLVLALCLCLLVGCGGKQTGYDPLKGAACCSWKCWSTV